MAARIAILGFLAALTAFFLAMSVRVARSEHNVYLPMAGQTWLMSELRADQEQVWCVDSRADSYPNFVAQLRDVNDQYTERVGIKHRQVAWGDPACEVQHVMLPAFPCGSGAAACIYYANSPVVVHYAEERGYVDWRSAHGHELGHGLLNLHEQYRDSGGSIGCTGKSWTVMDCGFPHVRYPQTWDIENGCVVVNTSWCGAVQEPEPITYPHWDGGRWIFDDGGRVNSWSWAPDPAPCGVWYFRNFPIWDGYDPAWGGRRAGPGVWVHPGTWLWFEEAGVGSTAPACP